MIARSVQSWRAPMRRVAAPAPETKRLAFSAIDSDASGMIAGYASLFDVIDMAKDTIEPGAFSASLARRGPRGVRLLWQHDPKEPLGAWLSLSEDARGLHVRGRLNLAVARARDVFALIRQGAVDGLSIGFKPVEARTDAKSGVRRLSRIDLWEISIVTFPMLPEARVFAVERDASSIDGDAAALAQKIRRAASLFTSRSLA